LGPLIQIVAKAAKWCLAACFEVTDRFLIKIPKPLIVISMASGAMCNTKPRPLRVKIKNTLPQRNKVMHTLGAACSRCAACLLCFVAGGSDRQIEDQGISDR
jgi:hypothetical protein